MRDGVIDKYSVADLSGMLRGFTSVHETSKEIVPTRIMQNPF